MALFNVRKGVREKRKPAKRPGKNEKEENEIREEGNVSGSLE